MKLRTSFFNPAAFKKDVTRFAPAWVLYSVALFMILSVCMVDNSGFHRAINFATSLSFMAALNLVYGLLNAQLLFGDLFNARHCNALHAMHLRRECWFFSHITAGLLFAIVPNLVVALTSVVTINSGWEVSLWWFLAACLQYLFFFGLAVFSSLCVGNRFAMVLVYGIINFFSLIVYWFYDTLYEPLLYGVRLSSDAFTRFCPVWTMIENYDLVQVIGRGGGYTTLIESIELGDDWGYLGLCAALGAGLLALALLLYRRRKLESAGDFMAVRILEPVFLTLYTLSMAAFFQFFNELFGGDAYIFLAIGLAVGFFTGRMLLMRTTRVFQPKGLLAFAIFVAIFVGSMLLARFDPLGVTRYIPDTDDIARVYLNNYYNPENTSSPTLSGDNDIDTVRQLHDLILSGETHNESDDDSNRYINLSFHYVLKNGTTVLRTYEVANHSPAGQLAEAFLTRFDYVLGSDPESAIDDLHYIYLNYYAGYYDGKYSDISGELPDIDAIREGLIRAIEADCAEGNMAQNWGYHEDEENVCWLQLEFLRDGGMYEYASIEVYSSARHTVAYIEEAVLPLLESQSTTG